MPDRIVKAISYSAMAFIALLRLWLIMTALTSNNMAEATVFLVLFIISRRLGRPRSGSKQARRLT